MTGDWTRNLTLILTGIVLSGILIILTNASLTLADVPWPTPPPGPRPAVPNVIGEADIKRVEVPQVANAVSWVVLPLAMSVPRFPPVPTSSFRSPDGVLIASDAGSIISTVQLVYQPVSLENAPSTAPHQELRKVFFLRTYDHRGKQVTPELLRPWVLEVPIQGLTQP